MSSKLIRCAVYTRKSQEEGLDQAFNSLDAQREAGFDYIRSQKHEGWQAIETAYDDGGFTGGNMERPGLKQLLKDIDYGLVDVVVVYKVDRLSRSLSDFAAMMKVFEDRDVSFVSVTQQFNTTTSMGRLTLNMLLSFAQFEREVTGERIRDKIAATKKKGLWVGGQPPLGYRLKERKLHIHPPEAELVEKAFREFLEAEGSMLALAEKLNSEGYTTRYWVSSRGREHGGKPLTAKYLRHMLTNPLYVGRIVHKDKDWKGQHEPIIPRKLWDRVQNAIDTVQRQKQFQWDQPHLLKGKLRTHEGFAMSPSSVHRSIYGQAKSGGKRLVRYYVSQKGIQQGYKNCPIKTINAKHLDELVRAAVCSQLSSDDQKGIGLAERAVQDHWIRGLIVGVVLGPDELLITLGQDELEELGEHDWPQQEQDQAGSIPNCVYTPAVEVLSKRRQVRLKLGLQIKRLDGKRVLLSPEGYDLVRSPSPEPEAHIVRAIGTAYSWRKTLVKDQITVAELSGRVGVDRTRIHKLLRLTCLGPDILKRALSGELPSSTTLLHLIEAGRELDWKAQHTYLGIDLPAAAAG
ncbi:MAG: recombinase family protein [Planctomycetota bacterium]